MKDKYYCKVCGNELANAPWGIDGTTPTYEICPCCGVEFGNEDYTLESVKRYREQWIYNGAKWFRVKMQPKNWDLGKQLGNISITFR